MPKNLNGIQCVSLGVEIAQLRSNIEDETIAFTFFPNLAI